MKCDSINDQCEFQIESSINGEVFSCSHPQALSDGSICPKKMREEEEVEEEKEDLEEDELEEKKPRGFRK